MFAALNSLADVVSRAATQLAEQGIDIVGETDLFKLDPAFNDEEESSAATSGEGVESSDGEEVDWSRGLFDLPSSRWTDPPAEWAAVARAALLDENTFLVSPASVMASPSAVSRLDELGISEEVLRAAAALARVRPPQAVMERVVSVVPGVLQLRSSIVPRYVSDSAYWVNVSWRHHLCVNCATVASVLDVMQTANTEPNPLDTTGEVRRENVGVPNNAAYWQQVRDELLAARTFREWVERRVAEVTAEMDEAMASLQLLRSLVEKREVSELSDSVWESCKYRKVKLAKIISELDAVPQRKVEGTALHSETGKVYLDMRQLLEPLQKCIGEYQLLKESPMVGHGATALAGAAVAAHAATEPLPTVSSTEGNTTPLDFDMVERISGVASGDDASLGAATFTAELPWDDPSE